MSSIESPVAIAGDLTIDFIIGANGRVSNGCLGGSAIYAAVGARIWSKEVHLFARVSPDMPKELLAAAEKSGILLDGLVYLNEPAEMRTFFTYESDGRRVSGNPASHYLRAGRPLPKDLIGFRPDRAAIGPDVFPELSVHPEDLENQVTQVPAWHLASAPHASQCLVGQRLRDLGVRWVTLDPSTSVMAEADPDRLAQALRNADAFLPSEKQVRAFFQREALDIWDMAEQLGEMGSRFVVIKRGANGQAIYDHQSGSRWQVPAYPARVQDVTGAGHSYAGGFLSGLVQTQDPLEAGLRGAVSASMVVEGSGALYALHAMPGLADARLESLRQSTHRL